MTRINLNDGTPERPLSTEERQHEIIRELVEDRDKLRAQLRAYEGSLPLDEQRELQVQLRQQGNELEELRSEVARLTRELEDVRKLDEWADQETFRGWRSSNDSSDKRVTLYYSPRHFLWKAEETHAAARRAAVEYLEREKADG